MNREIKLLDQALDMLSDLHTLAFDNSEELGRKCIALMDEIEACVLGLPEQEPVAWRWLYNGKPDSDKCFDGKGPDADVILRAASSVMPRTVQYFYTAPPSKPWVSLTDDEVWEAYEKGMYEDMWFARAIEAKLKEKNT